MFWIGSSHRHTKLDPVLDSFILPLFVPNILRGLAYHLGFGVQLVAVLFGKCGFVGSHFTYKNFSVNKAKDGI